MNSNDYLEQTLQCPSGRKINITLCNDGTLIVSGAQRVNVVQEAKNMDRAIARMAPESNLAIMVTCGPDHVTAEMVRSGAPWMGMDEIPRMCASFMAYSQKEEIHILCTGNSGKIPIAPSKTQAA